MSMWNTPFITCRVHSGTLYSQPCIHKTSCHYIKYNTVSGPRGLWNQWYLQPCARNHGIPLSSSPRHGFVRWGLWARTACFIIAGYDGESSCFRGTFLYCYYFAIDSEAWSIFLIRGGVLGHLLMDLSAGTL